MPAVATKTVCRLQVPASEAVSIGYARVLVVLRKPVLSAVQAPPAASLGASDKRSAGAAFGTGLYTEPSMAPAGSV